MQFPQLVQAVTLSTWGGRMPRAVKRSAILNTSFGHRARQMPQPSAPLHSFSLIEMMTGFVAIGFPSLLIPQPAFRALSEWSYSASVVKGQGLRPPHNRQTEPSSFGQQRLGDVQLLQMQGVLDADEANLVQGRVAHRDFHGLAVGFQDHGQPAGRPEAS